MKIYHLSHTDLDGYSCQFVSSFYLKNVEFYNSNYGKEIDKKMSHIISKIGDEKAVILITDLNLTKAQQDEIQKQRAQIIKSVEGDSISLAARQLLEENRKRISVKV